MSDLDLYDDLLTETGQERQGVPDEKYEALVAENETLKKELEASRKECETLNRNIHSLLATAKAELERKDNQLRDLQNRYDALVFRRSGGQPSERPIPLPSQPNPIKLKALANPQSAIPPANDISCETPLSRDEDSGRSRPEASSRSNVRQFSARVGQVKIEQSRASRTPPQSVEIRQQVKAPIRLDGTAKDGTDKEGWTHHGKLAIRRIPAEEKDERNRSRRDSSGEARSKPTTSFDSPKSMASAKKPASQNRSAATTNEAKESGAKESREIPCELSIARVTVTKSDPQSVDFDRSRRDEAKKPEKVECDKRTSSSRDTKGPEVQKKDGSRAGSKDAADHTKHGKDHRENDPNCKQETSVPSADKKPPAKSTPAAANSASSAISSHHFMHFLASPDDSKPSNGTSVAVPIESSPASKRKRTSKTRSRGVARRNRTSKKNVGSANETKVKENTDEVGYLSDTDSIFEAHPSLLEPPSPFPLCKMGDPPPSEEAPAENPIDEVKNDQMFTKPKPPVEVEKKTKKEVAKRSPSVPDPMDKVGQIMSMMKASHQAGCTNDGSKQTPTMDFPRKLERSPILGPGAGVRQSSFSPLMRSSGANVADPAKKVGEGSRKDDGRRLDEVPKLGREPSPLARTSEPSKDPRLPEDRGQRTSNQPSSSEFRRPLPSDRLSSTSDRKTTDVKDSRDEKPSPSTLRRPSSPERRSSSSDRFKTEVKDGVMASKQSSSSSLHRPSSDRRNAEAFNEKTSESQQPSSRKPNESLCLEKDVSSRAVLTKTASDPTSELPGKSEGQRTDPEVNNGLSSSGSGMAGTIPPRRAARRRVTLSSSGVKIAAVIEPLLGKAESRAEKNGMKREQLSPEQKKPIPITVKPVMKSDGNPRVGEFPANLEEENLIKPTEPETRPSDETVVTSAGTMKEEISSSSSRKRPLEATPVASSVFSTDASPSPAAPPSAKRRRRAFNLSSSGVILA